MMNVISKFCKTLGMGLVITATFSCKNELNINAKWKETIVVYGMLDCNDSVQYLRIGRAFLNTVSGAIDAAKNSDSLFLDSASVILYSTDNSFRDTLRRVWNMPKDSGLFANDKNPLYKAITRGAKALDPAKRYRIEVVSAATGKRVWAETNMVGKATIFAPFRDSNSNFSVTPEYFTISLKPGTGSYAYDAKLRVTYQEFPKSDTNKKVTKTAEWNVLTNATALGTGNMIYKIPRLALLQFLGASISRDSNYYHRLKFANLNIYGGNQILTDYISVNEPSIGIVQKQAEYSNINGGVGLFASRCIQRIERVKFDGGSITFMRNHAETKALNLLP
jgi:hypothetical protein